MEKIILKVTGKPSLRFTGELLAEVNSSNIESTGNFSGSTTYWEKLYLYKTARGKYVCGRAEHSLYGNSHTFIVEVYETIDEVKDFFGYEWLAKDLYDEANIDDAIEIE